MSFAFVSLITSNEYLPGALCLSKSLKSSYPLVILAVPEKLTTQTVNALYDAFDFVIFVSEIRSTRLEGLDLLGRRDLISTLTKIHCFNPQILKYDRICFLDADVLVLENIDGIFNYLDDAQVMLAAAPDVGWPDCFNSGVFVTRPSAALYLGLLDLNRLVGSFDGGDQGLLNSFFSGWSGHNSKRALKTARLPFTYNVTPTAFYSYLPAFSEFNSKISCIHFIGKEKPWNYERFVDGGIVPRYVKRVYKNRGSVSNQTLDMIRKWWDVYDGAGRSKRIDSHRMDKMGSSNHHVTWRNPEIVSDDDAYSRYKNVPLQEFNSGVDSSNSGSNTIECNPNDKSQATNKISQSLTEESRLTPYLAFEQRFSSHAKQVEKNPPASFSNYKIYWDNSQ